MQDNTSAIEDGREMTEDERAANCVALVHSLASVIERTGSIKERDLRVAFCAVIANIDQQSNGFTTLLVGDLVSNPELSGFDPTPFTLEAQRQAAEDPGVTEAGTEADA